MTEQQIKALLNEHRALGFFGKCVCGEANLFTLASHRAHVAEAIAAAVSDRLRAAEIRGHNEGYKAGFQEAHDRWCDDDGSACLNVAHPDLGDEETTT